MNLKTSLPFEPSSKRRKGISFRNQSPTRPQISSRQQGTHRKARPQWSMSLWFRAQISRTVVWILVNSMVTSGITIQESGRVLLLMRKLQMTHHGLRTTAPLYWSLWRKDYYGRGVEQVRDWLPKFLPAGSSNVRSILFELFRVWEPLLADKAGFQGRILKHRNTIYAWRPIAINL